MEDQEENYFVRNGCVDKILERQSPRDQVVVSFPTEHEAVFSGFKFIDLDVLKKSGINRFYFTFGPSQRSVVFTATLQENTHNPEKEFVRRRTRGPVRIDEYIGPMNDSVARDILSSSDVLKIESGPNTYRVYYLKSNLMKLKNKTPEIFKRQSVAGKRRKNTTK